MHGAWTVVATVLLAVGAAGCSNDDGGGAEPAGAGGGAGAGAGGLAGSAGGGAAGAAGAEGGSAGAAGSPDAGEDADASIDATEEVVDAPIDPFADAPPRPTPDDPLSIVLYGAIDGVELTGIHDVAVGGDVCGPGFDVDREDAATNTASVRWLDTTTNLNPVLGPVDEIDYFDLSFARYIKVDGATRLLTFRAGQLIGGSDLLGEVKLEELETTGRFDAFFHVTRAQRFVDSDEGIKDGSLYVWVTGDCRP